MLDTTTDNDEIISVDNLDDQFGNSEKKSNFKKFEKTTYFTFKNGENVFRVMPPMFTAKDAGHFAVYYARHYGYQAKGKPANFICLRQYDQQTQAMTQNCPFCVDQEQKKKDIENLSADLNLLQNRIHEAKLAKQDFTDLLDQFENTTEEHNRAKNLYNSRNARFWVNAMNLNGEFGLLALPKTAYETLMGRKEDEKDKFGRKTGKWSRTQGLIAKTKEKDKIDPLAVNEGVWFVITRTGSTQFDTEYSVHVRKEEIELPTGDVVEKTQRAPLSEQQKREALTKCKDLNTVFNHLVLTQEQAEAVVNGSEEAAGAVMDAPRQVETPVAVKTQAEPKTISTVKTNNAALLEKFKQMGNKKV